MFFLNDNILENAQKTFLGSKVIGIVAGLGDKGEKKSLQGGDNKIDFFGFLYIYSNMLGKVRLICVYCCWCCCECGGGPKLSQHYFFFFFCLRCYGWWK